MVPFIPGKSAGKADHFFYGGGSFLEIVRGGGVFLGETAVHVFEVWKPDIDVVCEITDRFKLFVAAAVKDDRDLKLRLREIQGADDRWSELGPGHEVDVCGAFFLEFQKDIGEAGDGDGFSVVFVTQLEVLAEDAA